jgi:hypothetical protein
VTSSRIEPGGFFTDEGFDFEARSAIGAAAAGIGDVGLVLATLDSVTDGDSQSWFDAWSQLADRMSDYADSAAAEGHLASARWGFLAGAEYFAKALGAVDGLADQSVLLPTFTAHRRCWDAWIDSSEGRHVRFEIPYQGPAGSSVTTLPGYLLRPDAGGEPRPTLVMTNGSDGSLSAMVGSGGPEALSRGWNVCLYDGPGQQSMLFEHNVPFRHDWEAVLTPVIDALLARPDVDATALTGYGISQAGYWLPRALAFEHRMVAAVADPGVVDVSTSWTGHLPPEMLELLHSGQKDVFNGYMQQVDADPATARTLAFRMRPYGTADVFDVYTEVERYHLRDVADRISTPLLITEPQDEQFWPGQSARLAAMLTGPKLLIEFTRQDGANFHCQPMGRRLTDMRMFDWLEEQLAAARNAAGPAGRNAAGATAAGG